jgi:6-phosphogluconolactonase (cycloisomerase 2 family)
MPGLNQRNEGTLKSQSRKHLSSSAIVSAVSLGLLFLPTGCANPSTPAAPPFPTPAIPIPTIAAISPISTLAGSGAGFTLTVNGTNFVATSVINFGGTTPATMFVSSWQLTAAIPAAAISSAGPIAVTVTNRTPGGGTSNMVQFAINNGTYSIPTISSVYPDPGCVPVGAQAFALSVSGANLVPNSVIRWNGTDLPTQFYNADASQNILVNAVLALVPASDTATAGIATVTVFNPAPGGGVSNPVSFNITAGGVGPIAVAVDPTGKFAYAANVGCGDFFNSNVSMYTINPADGTLTSAGPPVTTGDYYADLMAIDPSGRFAYVANGGDPDGSSGSLSMYSINGTTGTLTPKGMISGAFRPAGLAMHPSGKFVYVANSAGDYSNVSMYALNATTENSQLLGSVPVGTTITSLTVDPSGKFAYVGIYPDDPNKANLLIYSINPTTGVLMAMGTIPGVVSTPWIAIHPSGKFVYVVDENEISTYTLNATTGNLTSSGTLAATPGPIVIHPSGKFAYVTSSAGVTLYTIDATTGALTFAGTTAAGTPPDSITIHPSGKFAYETNQSSNSVSMYSVDTSTGFLTLIGTIGT